MTTKIIRCALIAVGVAALGYAAFGVVTSHDTRLAYARFLVLALTGHELVLMPLAILASVLISRFVTANARPQVQAAVIASAAITIIALPGVLGFGRSRDLPSALPRNYGLGLLIILVLIWSAAGLGMAVNRRKPSS